MGTIAAHPGPAGDGMTEAVGEQTQSRAEQLEQPAPADGRSAPSRREAMELFEEKLIRGSVHPYTGMEAIAVGVCSALGEDDYITSHAPRPRALHREGSRPAADDGRDHRPRGRLLRRQGRQHAHHRDAPRHARRRRDRRRLGRDRHRRGVRPAAPGQGRRGRLRSSATARRTRASSTRRANLAAVLDAPVVFVCENNQWAISTPFRRGRHGRRTSRSARPATASRARSSTATTFFAVREVAERAVARARAGEGPTLIEAKTLPDHAALGRDAERQPAARGARRSGARATRSSASRATLVERRVSRRRASPSSRPRRPQRWTRRPSSRSRSPFPEPGRRARRRLRAERLERRRAAVDERAAVATRELTMSEALNEALREEMEPRRGVFVIGEDIAAHGGLFKVTAGLLDRVRPGAGDRLADLRGRASPAPASAPRSSAAGRSSSCRSRTSSRSRWTRSSTTPPSGATCRAARCQRAVRDPRPDLERDRHGRAALADASSRGSCTRRGSSS